MTKNKSNSNKINLNQKDETTTNEKLTDQIDESKNLNENNVNKLAELLGKEKQKVSEYENKLKLSLADFQNLERKFSSDLEKNVNAKIDQLILDFLQIYDDFLLAKDAYVKNKIETSGLDSILKNMNSLLSKYNVVEIEAIGEIFNPNFHEAISIIQDQDLDDDTITKVIRKGYISHQTVIRPALVEISKK